MNRCFATIVMLAAGLVPVAAARAHESIDERFLAALRERRLFQLAESHCRRRLAQPDLSPRQRAELAGELSRCYAEHARQSPPDADDRDGLWRKALEATLDFARQYPGNPRRILVRTQGALAALAHGELLRREAEVLARAGPRIEQAKEHLREAIDQLTQIETELKQEILLRNQRRPLPDGALSLYELIALENNLHYQLARARRNQALCYPPGSADRLNSLDRALARLAPVARATDVGNMVWRARIDEAICLRLKGSHDAALKGLKQLSVPTLPDWARMQLQAELIRVRLAQEELDEAVAVVRTGRQLNGRTSAELDLAHLEAYLAKWQQALRNKNDEQATQWQDKATEQVRLIEADHGPFWTRLADTRLATAFGRDPSAGNLRTRLAVAERFYRAGQLEQAVAAYDAAVRQAHAERNTERAFELARTAAAIEEKRKNLTAARDRFRRLAVDVPRHQGAPRVHLQAIYLAARIARGAEKPSLDEYARLIEEHLHLWPSSPTAGEVHWRAGWLAAGRRDWPRAVAAFRAVPADHARYAQAVADAATAYRRHFAQLQAAGESTTETAKQAATYFERVITGPDGQAPRRWSPLARLAAVTAAEFWLFHTDAGHREAEEILTAALAGSPDAPADWISNVQSLRVVSLAGQGRSRQATDALRQVSGGSPDKLLALLDGLSRIAGDARPALRRELAALQTEAVQLLEVHWNDLDPPQRRKLRRLQAEALTIAGDRDGAARVWKEVAAASPDDGTLQQQYARFLTAEKATATQLTAGVAQWREIERRSPKGSPRWFTAKYEQAHAHERLGDQRTAARIVKLLQVLHPQLGGPQMRSRFLELLKRCQS